MDSLKDKIKAITDKDPFELSPETLYKNILNSTGPDEVLAKIFEVSVELVKEIKSRG